MDQVSDRNTMILEKIRNSVLDITNGPTDEAMLENIYQFAKKCNNEADTLGLTSDDGDAIVDVQIYLNERTCDLYILPLTENQVNRGSKPGIIKQECQF